MDKVKQRSISIAVGFSAPTGAAGTKFKVLMFDKL